MSWNITREKYKIGQKYVIDLGPKNINAIKKHEHNSDFLKEMSKHSGKIFQVISVEKDGIVRLNGEEHGIRNWGVSEKHHFILKPFMELPENLFKI